MVLATIGLLFGDANRGKPSKESGFMKPEPSIQISSSLASRKALPSFLDRFAEQVPPKPYAAHMDKVARIRGREHALRHEYIQCNGPKLVRYLHIDVDHAMGLHGWRDAVAPVPNGGMVGESGRPHYIYEVAVPVRKVPEGRWQPKPLYWAANIERRLVRAFDADGNVGAVRGGGILVKNPLHPSWSVEIWRDTPYSLDELDEALAPMRNPPSWVKAMNDNREVSGLGRHCALFDRLRYWAYSEVEDARSSMSLEAWGHFVYERADSLNDFSDPLDYQDVRDTAKSVSRWTWRHYTAGGGRARKRPSVEEKAAAIVAAEASIRTAGQRPTIDMIAQITGLNRATVSRIQNTL